MSGNKTHIIYINQAAAKEEVALLNFLGTVADDIARDALTPVLKDAVIVTNSAENDNNPALYTYTALGWTIVGDGGSGGGGSGDPTTLATVGAVNASATSKTTPVDADGFPIVDSEDSNLMKFLSFTNLKAFLKSYFDTIYTSTVNLFNKVTDDSDDITEGASNLFVTPTEKARIGFIAVTQPVDLDQMETDIAALANGMVYKGDWDASAGTFPGAGSAQTGWFYYVSVGGTVNSVEFTAGDTIVATTDNASASTYAGNWSKHDQTDAVQSVAGLVGSITVSALRSALNVENGADVTDKENVQAAMLTAANETSLAASDKLMFLKASASNFLRLITWSNFRTEMAKITDDIFRVQDPIDTTKEIAFDAGAIATGTVRTITMPDADIELGELAIKTQTDFISLLIEAPDDGDYIFAQKIPHAGTITKIVTMCDSGTCTLTGKINTTALGGTANSVSSTEQEQSHGSANNFSENDDLRITISSNSSCTNMRVMVVFTKVLS